MTAPERWIGKETEQKERDFRGLLHIHIPVCKSILSRYYRPTSYLYVDLHGGPGNLTYKGRRFLGSPLVALEELSSAGIPCETLHFEHDFAVAADLKEAVITRRINGRTTVREYAFETGVARWLDEQGRQPYRLGLVYSDPIADPIPVRTFNLIAQRLPRVDLLAYVSATNQYKRANANGNGHGRRLADDIAAVQKRHVLIREAHRAEQYTFILWSNWNQLPDWKKRGFHRLDSPRGREILAVLDSTKEELKRQRNTPLPGLEPDQPYRTYAEYLHHPRFLAVRALVFERACGICERCGERPATEPHHLAYPPWGAFDVPENLIAVCHPCHCQAHGKER